METNGIWIFLDCEGPLVRNDNAEENTVELAEKCGLGKQVGIDFYRRLSDIDDIWGDFHRIPKDLTYSSGHTLKVVLPFYKAMGANSQWLYEFAKENIRVVPNVGEVLVNLNHKYNTWMISTSYEFFIQAFCDLVNFDFARTHCTSVGKFDEISITEKESAMLLNFMKEAACMPVIGYDRETGEIIPEHQSYYDRFTNFIWETVYNMRIGYFLRAIRPVGQIQKQQIVRRLCRVYKVPQEKVIYIGDSQTDVEVVRYLRDSGLTIMFNGKGQVCHLSNIMYIGEDARVIEEVADLFNERGRQGTIDYYTPPREAKCGGLLAVVTPENVEELEKASAEKRKEFRGVCIGELT